MNTLETDPAVAAEFREAMSRMVGPVTVITTISEGAPYGTTASAVISLSMNPAMILVSLDRSSNLLAAVKQSRRFGVNVLAGDQGEIAGAFARKGIDKFAGIAWNAEDDLPRLADVHGWVACEVADIIDGGDHEVLLGRVLRAGHTDALPLSYYSRTFGTHVAH